MTTSSPGYQAVVLAALLHDVGKVGQRGRAPLIAQYAGVANSNLGLRARHARWSACAFDEIVPPTWSAGADMVFTHHLPRSYEAKIVAVADRLTSSDDDDREADDLPAGAGRLVPIFSRIGVDLNAPRASSSFPLTPLRLDRATLYPHATHSGDVRADYGRLWSGFLAEAKGNRELGDFEPFLTILLGLLEKYTWCVPTGTTTSFPDVSLYDHARGTAALAACLWQTAPSEADLDALLESKLGSPVSQTPRFALWCGDLSGVQRFLYNVASRGAARTLRGRSLYLQLLGETAADYVLRGLELPSTNLLYVGGAKFYILAPLSALERIGDLRRQLAEKFLELGGGDLYLALGAVPLTADDLRDNFAESWARVGAELQRAKSRRMAEVADTHYDELFGARGRGGSVAAADACDICATPLDEGEISGGVLRCAACRGREAGQTARHICAVCRREIDEGTAREGLAICDACEGFRALGETVSTSQRLFLTVSTDAPPDDGFTWQRGLFRAFGRRLEFGSEPKLGRREALAYLVNDTEFREAGAHGFRLGAFVAPRVQLGEQAPKGVEDQRDRTIKSFEWLAAESVGVPYLGLLRMDVDGLGNIFRLGLKDAANPSRVATLSRAFRLFFEGWFGELVREIDRADHSTTETMAVIYSGGDDLFVVGPWDRLLRLARAIRRELGAFCADNPAVTISAGLAVADSHYPLNLFADEAKSALDDQAKEFRRANGMPKDAINFLGTTVAWEDYDRVAETVAELVGLVDGSRRFDRPVSRALIHDFARIAEEQRLARANMVARRRPDAGDQRLTVSAFQQQRNELAKQSDRLVYGRWQWMAHYQLSRFVERLGRPNESPRREVKALADRLIQPETIGTLGLVARWAEYLVRKGD